MDQKLNELTLEFFGSGQHKISPEQLFNLDEAVFLADEIVIMTSRPGRIRNKIKVDMERPRTRALPRFGELTDFILRELA